MTSYLYRLILLLYQSSFESNPAIPERVENVAIECSALIDLEVGSAFALNVIADQIDIILDEVIDAMGLINPRISPTQRVFIDHSIETILNFVKGNMFHTDIISEFPYV